MDGPPASRNFALDFLMPALQGLSPVQARRVALALDTAIWFGALEHANGNDSLISLRALETRYWDNVRRLRDGDV